MKDIEINIDINREKRIGVQEAILCSDKSINHILSILDFAEKNDSSLLLTRLSHTIFDEIKKIHPERIDYDVLSQTAYFGEIKAPISKPSIVIVSAGTSDASVATEIERTLYYHGVSCNRINDVGVAGISRLFERLEDINKQPIVIVVAGMDGALPSVLGGLIEGVLIAVPTSVGYGVAEKGKAALYAALASCSPGILVVNIDNGYGAAIGALRILRAFN